MSTPFEQELYNRLSTIFERTVGTSLDIRQIDRLNDESKKLADLLNRQINKVAQERALEVCKLLNVAVADSFKVVARDIAEIKQQIANANAEEDAGAARAMEAVNKAVSAVRDLTDPNREIN